jgi:pimeloyl-ACP methyl ester carboxylesterase
MVDGLCLFHSTAKADSSEKKKKRDQTRDFIQEKGVVAFVKNFIPGLFAEAGRKNMQNSIADVIQLAARTPQPTATAAMNAMRDRPDRQHVIRDASFPVMLVAGEQDLVVPVNDLEIQADLTNLAALRVIRNCGHMGMFENPKESIRVLQDFMAM